MTSQVPPALREVPTDSRPEAGQGKEVEAPQGKNKSKNKGKDKASDTTISLPEQAANPGAPKVKVQGSSYCNTFIFLFYCFCTPPPFFCTTLLILMKICSFCFIECDK